MNKFNKTEFTQICSKLNPHAYQQDITITYADEFYFRELKNGYEQRGRCGEVVFCVIRPNGKIITVREKEYPEGIFRIPTGGVEYNEDIINAVHREAKEELGIETQIEKFIGVIKIRFKWRKEYLMFYSYMFIIKEIRGNLLKDASDNEVSEVKEVDIAELETIVDSLGKIQGKWADWGRFRQVTSNAMLQYLKEQGNI